MLKGFSAQPGSYSFFFTEAQQLKQMSTIIWTKILPLPEDIYITDILNHALKTMLWIQDCFTEKWGRAEEKCPSAKTITLWRNNNSGSIWARRENIEMNVNLQPSDYLTGAVQGAGKCS